MELLYVFLLLAVRTACWEIRGARSSPHATGSLSAVLPNGTVEVGFLHVNASGSFDTHRAAVTASGTISWTSALPAGQYVLQAFPSGEIANAPIYLHAGYDLTGVASQRERYSVAGRESIALHATGLYDSQHAIVRFTRLGCGLTCQLDFGTNVTGEVDRAAGVVRATTPALMTPHEWFAGCIDVALPTRNALGTCVPDIAVGASLSLDGGATFAPTVLNITYGHVPKLKVAFIWTMAHNQGRLHLEREFGGLINVSTYVESVDDGEFEFAQPNLGATISTNTPVPEFFANGTRNLYYMGLEQLKRWCDEDFDLVFTTSFGFMSQTIDVSSAYAPCRHARDGAPGTPHLTHFVHATGHRTNELTSTMFGMVYQVKYLAGLVAGDALAAPRGSLMAMPRGGTCVAYVAPFPIPEVQRHINAFAIGCRARFPHCVVKAVFTGSWHNKTLEGAVAHMLWNEEGCDLITQGTDDSEPQLVYAAYGGHGIGYNYDMRQIVGESVLNAPMLNWGNIYSPFVSMKLNGEWTPEQRVWRGVAEGAVGLAPTFSPRVEDATIQVVEEAMERLRAAPGAEAFKHIFCGPLTKRWVYAFADGTAGPRARGCGAGNPVWRRLDTPEQINVRHYRDADGQPLPADRTTPLATDCLWGVDEAGQALLEDAYPDAFDEEHVFNDYLLEGVELLDARTTVYGTVHSEASHGCGDFAAGDRFFSERPVAIPPSPPPPASPEVLDTPFPVAAVAAPIVSVVAVALAVVFACALQRRRAQKVIALLKEELQTFQDSIVGVRAAGEAFDPRQQDEGFAYYARLDSMGLKELKQEGALRAVDLKGCAEKLELVDRLAALGPPPPSGASPNTIGKKAARLCRELGIDDAPKMTLGQIAQLACQRLEMQVDADASNDEMIIFAYAVCFGEGDAGDELQDDLAWLDLAWLQMETSPPASIARAHWWWGEDSDRIDKHPAKSVKQPGDWVAYNSGLCADLDQKYHQYVKGTGPAEVDLDVMQKAFKVNFKDMRQINKSSGYSRKMLREQHTSEVAAAAVSTSVGGAKGTSGNAHGRSKTTTTRVRIEATTSKPPEIAKEDSLILYEGQLVQTSKQRSDGWAFGSVVLDVTDDRPPAGVERMSTQAGWFPLSKTKLPSKDQLASLQKKMGGGEGANVALKPPDTWQAVKDALRPEMVTLGSGAERQQVVDKFMATLGANITVDSVQRIQNMSMWQSYAVKRQTVLQREKDAAANKGAKSESRYERVWVFHGTDELTVPKIVEMGFNRSFCGKNATAYGKGVYFARDASYSSSKQYSRPNAQNIQHMFLCRVVVGEYCLGKHDQLTPDVRQGHQLYDSTVNNMADPILYVTYHDAQAYPEYLVRFKQG